MSKKVLAVAAASSAAVIATVAPATAGTVVSGAYQQHTGPLTCNTNNNTLHVTASGRETRPAGNHFRTDSVTTRIRAQVQNNDGSWSTVAVSGPYSGHLGAVHSNDAGTVNFRRFIWNGSRLLPLSIGVTANDNLFRANVISRLRDNENVLIKTLVNIQGQCRLPSNAARTAR
jgi:hypothetical protein